MIWYIIIALITILLLWVLLGPVMLTVDTTSNRYRFMLPGVVSVSLVPAGGFFHIRGWVFFVPFRMDPLKMGKSRRGRKKRNKGAEQTDTDKKKEKKQRGRQKGLESMKKFRKVAGAIRVRRLELDIDTDDYQLNAWLVPAFAAVNSYKNVQMQVNFEGNLSMHLDVRTRVGTVIWRILPWT